MWFHISGFQKSQSPLTFPWGWGGHWWRAFELFAESNSERSHWKADGSESKSGPLINATNHQLAELEANTYILCTPFKPSNEWLDSTVKDKWYRNLGRKHKEAVSSQACNKNDKKGKSCTFFSVFRTCVCSGGCWCSLYKHSAAGLHGTLISGDTRLCAISVERSRFAAFKVFRQFGTLWLLESFRGGRTTYLTPQEQLDIFSVANYGEHMQRPPSKRPSCFWVVFLL